MSFCPICKTVSNVKRAATPYFACSGCGVWYQDPMPPKIYHASHEGDPMQMSEGDKRLNETVAEWLLANAMGGVPGPTLDIGASYPWLAHSLGRLGCSSYAIDGSPELRAAAVGMQIVATAEGDFEAAVKEDGAPQFKLITTVHSFEHFYNPIAAVRKIRQWLDDDGRWYIRCPDNQVVGYERDLTPGHYEIHPFFHCLSSIAELCAQTQAFVIERTYELQPGQRDLVLKPI